jgi:hypothetical protein
MSQITDPMRVVADLEPVMLSQLADDGYARHRHDDLARAATEGHRTHRSPVTRFPLARPRWQLVTGAVAVTAAAAVAAVTLTAPSPAGGPRPATGATQQTTLDARTVLLGTAAVAARATETTGTYWYVEERDYEPSAPYAKHVKFKKSKDVTYNATFAATEESWAGPASARTIVDENLKFTFASAADEARWKAAGEPKLSSAAGYGYIAPVTSTYNMSFHWGAGTKQFSLAGIKGLPTNSTALSKILQRLWKNEPDKAAAVGFPNPSYGQYLVQWAVTLLTGPARAGTKAAIYQLLAQQPGLTILSSVTDPLHRTGVAVSDDGGDYLLIDPHTAQPLAYTTNPLHPHSAIPASGGTEVYVTTGWTNALGVQP